MSGHRSSASVGVRAKRGRRLPASERRAVILEAALRAFASNGYDGAGMEEIAAAAGVSKAVVYDHVASKRELYMLLLDSIRVELVDLVDDALSATEARGEPRVRAVIDAILCYVEGNPERWRLLLYELRGTTITPLGLELDERITTSIVRTLETDAGLFAAHPQRDRQLRILVELMKSCFGGLVNWWLRNPDIPRSDLVARTTDVVWPAIERARD
jgi:AcrR family transcriptional regulator